MLNWNVPLPHGSCCIHALTICAVTDWLPLQRRQGRHEMARGRPVVLMPAEAIITKSQFANQQEVFALRSLL